jgi:carbon monoxide dehydrogenase subunit G
VASIRSTAEIGAPAQKVWDFVCDLQRIPEWVGNTEAMLSVSEGPTGSGTTYRERSRIVGPWKAPTEWRITTFDAPQRQVHEGGLPMGGNATLDISLEPAAGGSRITVIMEVGYAPLLRPVGALLDALFMRRSLQADFDRNVQSLKKLVEQEPAA